MRGRRAYRRARDQKAAEAVQDKKLMDHVTGAAASLQAAVRALANQPPPKPKRRPLKTAALLARRSRWVGRGVGRQPRGPSRLELDLRRPVAVARSKKKTSITMWGSKRIWLGS